MSTEKNNKMILYNQVIDFIKNFLHQENDIEVAKTLGIKQSTFSERGKKGNISYKEIIDFCTRENISLDEIFGLKLPNYQKGEQAEVIVGAEAIPEYGNLPPLLKALYDMLKQIYIEGTVEDRAKVMGIIEAVYDEVERKKEPRFQKPQRESGSAHAEDEPEQKSA